MRNSIEFFWWGVQVNLDEANTQSLVSLLDNGGNAAGLLFAIDPEIRSKVAVGLAAALVKIGASVIKQVDQSGGSHGVTISHPWVGPVPGWVTAQ